MNSKTIPILIVILVLTSSSVIVRSQSLPQAIQVTSVTVHSGASPHLGDTVKLAVSFQANMSGAAVLHLQFPGKSAPPDQHTGETSRDSAIVVDSGSTYTDSIPLKLFGYGGSMVEAVLRPHMPIHGMRNASSGFVEIVLTSNSFIVRNQASSLVTDNVTVTPINFSSTGLHFHLSGNINYQDVYQTNFSTGTEPNKGVYGVKAVLLFHKPDLTQPTEELGGFKNFFSLLKNGACTQGINWCNVAVDGSYSFNFDGPPDWSAYLDATVLVTTSNSACLLTQPVATNIILTNDFGCGPYTLFGQAWSITTVLPSSGPITLNVPDIPLLTDDGATLRYMKFAQEYDYNRPISTYSNQLPGQISTLLLTYIPSPPAPVGAVGLFLWPNSQFFNNPVPEILLTKGSCDAFYVTHEFGHWAHYSLNQSTFLTADGDFREGFAEFHQFAVRNWANVTYGDFDATDDFIWTSDNLEESPWVSATRGERFGGMDYGPPAAGYGCFMWNVYDSYSDNAFRSSRYSGNDNDDVGETNLIFTILGESNPPTNTGGLESALESAVTSAGRPKEAASINDIYQCMTGDGTHLMRPPQVTNLSGETSYWDETAGDEGATYVRHYYIDLSWDLQNYIPLTTVYDNTQSIINVSQKNNNGNWQIIQTLDPDVTSVSLAVSPGGVLISENLDFQITTHNSSGDAYNAPTVTLPAFKRAEGSHSLISYTSGIAVTVHPNPSSSYARVCVASLPEGIPATVEIINLMGEAVTTLYNAAPEAELGLCLTLDCSRMPSGTYYARVMNDIMGTTVKFSVEH